MKRIVFCNAPRWFSSIWNVIARVLPETVLKKVDILYDMKGLDKYIHPSQRPVYYGGTDVELGCAIGHKEFLALELIWKQKQSIGLQFSFLWLKKIPERNDQSGILKLIFNELF